MPIAGASGHVGEVGVPAEGVPFGFFVFDGTHTSNYG